MNQSAESPASGHSALRNEKLELAFCGSRPWVKIPRISRAQRRLTCRNTGAV